MDNNPRIGGKVALTFRISFSMGNLARSIRASVNYTYMYEKQSL
jgi:hypothetical protein